MESRSRDIVTAPDRLHALDALRALAMLLVIVGHALLSYAEPPYGSLWVVRVDGAQRSAMLGAIFWWLHGFRLPLYFVLAGFFAAWLSAKRGAHGFLRHRIERVLVPLVVGGVILLPICFYVFAFGWWMTGECTWDEIRRVKFAPAIQAELWGPIHLWFLQYLLLYAVMFWACELVSSPARALSPIVTRCLAARWRPLWCALPTVLIIGIHPEVLTTHHNRFMPEPFEFVHYAIYFVWGVYLHRFDPTMARFAVGGRRYLLVSFGLIVTGELLLRPFFAGTLSGIGRIVLALVWALFAWFSIFGFLSVFQLLFARQRVVLQYLADAAYWIYLIHLPLVAALQITLAPVPLPVELKCALVIGVASGACLWSYERWVRYGAIGAILNGRRVRPAPTPPFGIVPRPRFSVAGEPPGEPPVPAFR